MRLLFSTLSIIIIITFFISLRVNIDYQKQEPIFENNDSLSIDLPNSMKMYNAIEKYSNEYDVPSYIAYNVAYLETRYRGPFDWNYKHYQESYAGALGPMQIMPKTADYLSGESIDRDQLMKDIELNVELSMKLLSRLHDKYGDWGIVCGYYNTGQPIVNSYASYCKNNKDYRDKWISIK